MTSTSLKIKFSVDDGCASDVRLANILEKYGLKMTVYLPVEWQRLAYENGYLPLTFFEVEDLIKAGHTLGSHTISHRHLTKLDGWEARLEINGSKHILEEMFLVYINDFCPPRGYTNKEIDKIIYEYYKNSRVTRAPELVHIHPNSGANDNRDWREVAKEKMKLPEVELWCHSWELDKYELWGQLEEWLSENIPT